MKKILSSILLSALFVLSAGPTFAVEATTPSGIKAVTGFSDVTRTHNAYVAITYLNESGVINGYADGSFKPDNAINRAEVLKVILQGAKATVADVTTVPFADVPTSAWFAKFVAYAKTAGIVSGNAKDGTFTPNRQVSKAEFVKMMLLANGVKQEALTANESLANDIPKDAWFAPYMNYAIKSGIVTKNAQGNAEPSKMLTRGEVAQMLYFLMLIKGAPDTQFLLSRAEAELAQIEVFIAANKVANAKQSSELAVDLTQQAFKNMPENNVVIGAAKLARSYDWLVDSFVYGIQKNFTAAAEWANKAIDKASEAWDANNATQPIAKHIKERAREILAQVGGKEE
jgi:hypothetical protein